MHNIEEVEIGDYRFTINHDECWDSPRELLNIATLLIWSRDVVSPDKTDYRSLNDFMEDWDDANGVIYFVEHMNYGGGDAEYRITKDRDRADGVIFATYATLDAEISDYTPGLVRYYFESELLTYTQYANGEVYSWSIYQKNGCDACGHAEWNFVEGCGGYFGRIDAGEINFPEGAYTEFREAVENVLK